MGITDGCEPMISQQEQAALLGRGAVCSPSHEHHAYPTADVVDDFEVNAKYGGSVKEPSDSARIDRDVDSLPDDRWGATRNVAMRCRTCVFFVPKESGEIGRCRKNPPTIDGFPVVFARDWCGRHRLDGEIFMRLFG